MAVRNARMSLNAGHDNNAGLGIPAAGQGNNVGPQGGVVTTPGRGGTAIDLMDKMSEGITRYMAELTKALSNMSQTKRHALQQLPQLPPQAQNQARESLSNQIENLYKRRKLAVEAGRINAMDRYDAQIDDLEAIDEERTRAQYCSNSNN
mmetsp:Transcript_11798/g.19150  ORF Transcript_11798/g.19150 Transcript_11798/m.19150 type:complete len:150 (-) Transcript_11798:247-696(-)